MFFGPYEAIAERLKTASAGSSSPVYAAPQFSFTVMVGESSTEQIQTTARLIAARRTRVTFATPTMPFDVEIWADDVGRLLRVNVPSQNLDVVRDDIASVMARRVPISRPNDEQVKLPANGFSLAGTLSKPAHADTRPLPAVVLIGGSGTADRDEPSSACRFSASWRARSPTQGSWCCVTTSAASARAAAASSRRHWPISRTTFVPR